MVRSCGQRPRPLHPSGDAATLAACLTPSIADEFLRTLDAVARYQLRGEEHERSPLEPARTSCEIAESTLPSCNACSAPPSAATPRRRVGGCRER